MSDHGTWQNLYQQIVQHPILVAVVVVVVVVDKHVVIG
jgi:hypothetical protein